MSVYSPSEELLTVNLFEQALAESWKSCTLAYFFENMKDINKSYIK